MLRETSETRLAMAFCTVGRTGFVRLGKNENHQHVSCVMSIFYFLSSSDNATTQAKNSHENKANMILVRRCA